MERSAMGPGREQSELPDVERGSEGPTGNAPVAGSDAAQGDSAPASLAMVEAGAGTTVEDTMRDQESVRHAEDGAATGDGRED